MQDLVKKLILITNPNFSQHLTVDIDTEDTHTENMLTHTKITHTKAQMFLGGMPNYIYAYTVYTHI